MPANRSARASRHADRGWECPCGRTVYGNGGKASHKRACRIYALHRLRKIDQVLGEIEIGEWGKNLSPGTVQDFEEMFRRERDRLKERLEE